MSSSRRRRCRGARAPTMTPRRPTPASWTTAAGPRRCRKTSREGTLRFPRRRLLDSVTRATQVDGQEPAALAQADAPARALPGQRLRGGRGVGTRAFLRSFVVAVLTPPPSLPPVYYKHTTNVASPPGARGRSFDAGSRSRVSRLSGPAGVRGRLARRAEALGEIA